MLEEPNQGLQPSATKMYPRSPSSRSSKCPEIPQSILCPRLCSHLWAGTTNLCPSSNTDVQSFRTSQVTFGVPSVRGCRHVTARGGSSALLEDQANFTSWQLAEMKVPKSLQTSENLDSNGCAASSLHYSTEDRRWSLLPCDQQICRLPRVSRTSIHDIPCVDLFSCLQALLAHCYNNGITSTGALGSTNQ